MTRLRLEQRDTEAAVEAFFDKHADHYVQSWDLRAHGLHVGMFEGDESDADALERAYERTRMHVMTLLQLQRPITRESRLLDVCCGTGATLAQIVRQRACVGVGVDISHAQIDHAGRLRSGITGTNGGSLLFRHGSGSYLRDAVEDQAPFTHAFSQEGFLFVDDKRGALESIHSMLEPGGAFVISDFVPQQPKEAVAADVRARVYDDVKWKQGLGFDQYLELLHDIGFVLVQAELRPLDMRSTYARLAERTRALAAGGDTTYGFLAERYVGIVQAIDDGALSWGWFAARKR